MKSKLEELQQQAIWETVERITEADKLSQVTRFGDLHSLHVSAYMDIERTTKSLNSILAYKKEASVQMLLCSDKKQAKHIAEIIRQADDMIMRVLGLNY